MLRGRALPGGAALLAALLAAGLACEGGARHLELSAHHLLLITIDTLRADRLGSYGHAGAETPHLDALARGGVRFESVYSSVPLTLPSHSTMFTGRYPFTTGVRTNGSSVLPSAERTLAEVLKDSGFATFAAVSAFVVTSKFGLNQGFDFYDDSLGVHDLFLGFDSEIPADRVYQKFLRGLDAREPGRFFGWVHFYDPHLPYEPPSPYQERFAGEPYDGEIAFVDSQVGKIVENLRARGLLEKTVVVVTSDHGEGFGEHGETGHSLLCYEEMLRVPLLLFAPGQLAAGTVISEPVRLLDLMPTLLDLFAIDPPAGMQGLSFAPLLRGKTQGASRSHYFESMAGPELKNWAPLQGIIRDRHKFIDLPIPELYDLENDPHEEHNLYRQRRRMAQGLEQELNSLLRSEASETGAARRELSQEDVRHLRTLGYLSTAGRSSQTLDPKTGMAIEIALDAIRVTINRGDLEQAQERFNEVLAENPNLEMPDFYDLRYELAQGRGDQKAAVAALREAQERFPDLEAFRLKLALYLFKEGRFDDAEREAAALLEINPTDSQGMVLLGRVAEKRGDLEAALSSFEQAAAFEPNSIPLQSRIADLFARTGQAEKALRTYEALLRGGALDGDAESLYKAAMLNTRAGNLDRAEELFRRGLALAPASIHYMTYALVLDQQGHREAAISALETALQQGDAQLTAQQVALATTTLEQWRRSP